MYNKQTQETQETQETLIPAPTSSRKWYHKHLPNSYKEAADLFENKSKEYYSNATCGAENFYRSFNYLNSADDKTYTQKKLNRRVKLGPNTYMYKQQEFNTAKPYYVVYYYSRLLLSYECAESNTDPKAKYNSKETDFSITINIGINEPEYFLSRGSKLRLDYLTPSSLTWFRKDSTLLIDMHTKESKKNLFPPTTLNPIKAIKNTVIAKNIKNDEIINKAQLRIEFGKGRLVTSFGVIW